MPRPHRNAWHTNGAVVTQWTQALSSRTVPLPTIRPFQPPKHTIDLGRYRSVLAVGDSVMQQFVSTTRRNKNRGGRYYYPNCAFGRNTAKPLLKHTLQTWYDPTANRLRAFRKVHNNTAVLLGTAAWELQRPYGDQETLPNTTTSSSYTGPYTEEEILQDHIEALVRFVSKLREDFPSVDIYWKTGLAMHLHIVARDLDDDKREWCRISRLRYMSQSRTERLYRAQTQAMQKLGIPILDLYPATYLLANRHRKAGDAIHYDGDTNAQLLSWYYPNGGVNESIYRD